MQRDRPVPQLNFKVTFTPRRQNARSVGPGEGVESDSALVSKEAREQLASYQDKSYQRILD